jgi:hypothetical protein
VYWECGKCGSLANDPTLDVCPNCGAPRNPAEPSDPPADASVLEEKAPQAAKGEKADA